MKKNYGYALLIYFCSLLLLDLLNYIFNFRNEVLVVLSYILFPSLLITIVYLLKEDLKVKVFDKGKASFKKTLSVIGRSFFIALAGIIIISLVRTFFASPNENNTTNDLIAFQMIIQMVLLGPIVEELVFRRIILNVFSKKFNIYVSIVLTSFLFSSWHMSLLSFPDLFWLSMVYSYSYYLTNRLSVPIILHIIWNLFAYSIYLLVK
ncbi:MAG TPA: type II CAAX endopeptidase family protein [Paenisporosarcina sp.]|nr:type II CAAX endopeptidase family protein [Paenisporosarcina sp.]